MSNDDPQEHSSLAPQVSTDPARSQLEERESIGRHPVSPEIVLDGDDLEVLPPLLAGHATAELELKARTFYLSVRSMFETWLQRTQNPNTQRTYRCGVLDFVEFLDIDWENRAHEFLQVTVPDVQAWRDAMQAKGQCSNLSRLSVLQVHA